MGICLQDATIHIEKIRVWVRFCWFLFFSKEGLSIQLLGGLCGKVDTALVDRKDTSICSSRRLAASVCACGGSGSWFTVWVL